MTKFRGPLVHRMRRGYHSLADITTTNEMDRLLVSYENIRLLGLVFKIIVYTYTQAKSLETILKN